MRLREVLIVAFGLALATATAVVGIANEPSGSHLTGLNFRQNSGLLGGRPGRRPRRMMRRYPATTVYLLLVALSLTFTGSAHSATSPTKILTIVEENHSLAEMQAAMPYLNTLAETYSYANNYTAITYPSLPNYLAITGGSTFGVTDDGPPSSHPISGASVFGSHGKSYEESMPSNCFTGNAYPYMVKHNPWPYFTAGRTQCSTRDVGLSLLASDAAAGTLPRVGLVTPNMCNDAHDCSVGTADSWLQANVPGILAGPDFTSGRLVVVITADSDDHGSGNEVLTVVLHAGSAHLVVRTALTHYSLARLQTQVAGAACLRLACTAPDMKAAFGL